MMKQKEKLRGAVVGAGFMGATHLAGYNQLSHVDICAIIDNSRERAGLIADPLQIPVYETIDEAAMEHRLDFIDICVPTPYHVDGIAAAFRNGCHVLVEKPLSACMEDIQKVRKLTEETDRRLMVAHVCRFMPGYVFAKQTAESGRLGKPLAFSAIRYIDSPGWSIDDWINDRTLSGGTIIDLSIHDIDIANWLLGTPREFNASEVTKVSDGPAHVIETIGYTESCAAHVEASHLLPKGFPLVFKYELVFEEGFLTYASGDTGTFLREFSQGGWKDIQLSGITCWEDPYTEEIDHFTSRLLDGKPFRVTLDDAILAVASALSLKESVSTGRRVRLLEELRAV